jgi:hypothetical protein
MTRYKSRNAGERSNQVSQKTADLEAQKNRLLIDLGKKVSGMVYRISRRSRRIGA